MRNEVAKGRSVGASGTPRGSNSAALTSLPLFFYFSCHLLTSHTKRLPWQGLSSRTRQRSLCNVEMIAHWPPVQLHCFLAVCCGISCCAIK